MAHKNKTLFSAFCSNLVTRKNADLWTKLHLRYKIWFKYVSNRKSRDKHFSFGFEFESCLYNVQPRFAKSRKVNLTDTVALIDDLPSYGLHCGQVGNIVELFDEEKACRVRFITPEGRDYASIVLQQDQLMVLSFRPDLYLVS